MSEARGETLCPCCLTPLSAEGRCAKCGRVLDQGDWPGVMGLNSGLAPWSSLHLAPPSEEGGAYRLPPVEAETVKGELETVVPYVFPAGKSCVRIGGSALVADICISGADSLHAALLLNTRSHRWWIYDCGSRCGTFVNGERVHARELMSNDSISVCGVRLEFQDDRLASGEAVAGGMSISVRNLSFSVPGREHPVLDNLTFRISPGEFIGVLGPSGCGKSSLVQRLIGLAWTPRGTVFVNGHDRQDVEEEFRAACAYLPQNVESTLHESLTLEEEINCFRRIHLAPLDDVAEEEKKRDSILESLGLSKRLVTRVGSMSGGEKRRVGIALALLRDPRILLLDEPGAGLDPASEGTLMANLQNIAKQGRTVICVTHVLANADRFHRLMVLSHGRIVYFDKPGGPQNLPKKFGVPDYATLYQCLEKGTLPSHYEPPVDDFSSRDLPVRSRRSSWWGVVCGYLHRFKMEFMALKEASSKLGNCLAWLKSSPMTYFVWQPLGLVVGLRVACAYYFRMDGNNQAHDVELLGFCAALSMFWIGINNAAREFVKERIPGRCLERLNQVPLSSYVVAKFLWSLILCAVQSLSFTVLLCVAGRIPVPLASSVDASELYLTSWWFVPLVLTCLMGAFCGLAVSAVSKRELGAVAIVPNIAILALLFSNSVVQFEQEGGYFAPVARTLATHLMPCHWSAKFANDLQVGTKTLQGVEETLILLACYLGVSVCIAFFSQGRNERAWDGR